MSVRQSLTAALALSASLVSGQALAGDTDANVFGLKIKSGFSSGEVKVVDLGDDIVFSTKSCSAVLVPAATGSGAYDLIIDKQNARGCKKISGVTLGSTSGDILKVGIRGKRKTKTYALPRLATQRDAVTLPTALSDVRGISLAMNNEEVLAALGDMAVVVHTGRASRNWGSRSGLVVYSEPARNATEQIIVLGAGSSPGPAMINRHREPRGDDRPDRKTLISALEDKYGKPSLRKTARKVEFMEWHFDPAGTQLIEESALACSALSPKKSKTTFSRTLKAPGMRRGHPNKLISVSAAFECGTSMKVTIIAMDKRTTSEMYQTLYRHDYLMNAELEKAVQTARSRIEASKTNVEKEKTAPKL